jgi:hypothetical protein
LLAAWETSPDDRAPCDEARGTQSMRLESMTGDEMNTSATLPAEAPDTSPRPRVAPFPPSQLEEIRRTRRYPRRTDPYYLILRILVLHLESVLREIRHPVNDVLDLYCGTQPYRDLLPPHTRYVSLDIDERYGVPDVVSDEFLPFPDASFDLILFTEAFHYVTDPAHAARLGIRPAHRRAALHGTASARAVPGLGRDARDRERGLQRRLGDPQ